MLLFAALLALSLPSPSPAPEDIYRAALRRLATLPQPAYIDDTEHREMVAETPAGRAPAAFDERVLFDCTARRETVFILPYSVKSSVIFSQSYFAPDMWLIHRPAPNAAPSDFSPDLSDLKTIASLVSVAKPSYDIRLAGVDKLSNGVTAYHLTLRPLGDPLKHNLRELWVNTVDSNIMRAVVFGNYRPDPDARLEQSTAYEDFGQVGPYWVVIHHTWAYTDMFAQLTIHFESTAQKMSFPHEIPAWYFDQTQFDAHRSQVNLSSQWP